MPREENNAREAQAKRHVSVMKAVFGTETAASIEGAQIIEAGYAPQPEVAEGAAPERRAVHEPRDYDSGRGV